MVQEFINLSKEKEKEIYKDLNQTNLYEKELLKKIKYKTLFRDKRFLSVTIPLVEKDLQDQRNYLFTIKAFKEWYFGKCLYDPIIEFFESCYPTLDKNITIFDFLIHLIQNHTMNKYFFSQFEEQIIQYAKKDFIIEMAFEIITIPGFQDEIKNYQQQKKAIEEKIAIYNESLRKNTLQKYRSLERHNL